MFFFHSAISAEAVLYLIRQFTPLPAKMPRIMVEKSSRPRNKSDPLRWGTIAPIIPIESFEVKIDIESINGIQLPGITSFFFSLSNWSCSLCICKNPIKKPTPKQSNQKRIAKGLAPYFPKNEKRDQPKNKDGIKSKTAIGTALVLFAFKPPSNKIANKGHTNIGILVIICSINFSVLFL